MPGSKTIPLSLAWDQISMTDSGEWVGIKRLNSGMRGILGLPPLLMGKLVDEGNRS